MLVQHYTGGCRPQSECGSAANVKTNERIDADSLCYAKTVICTFHQQAPGLKGPDEPRCQCPCVHRVIHMHSYT